MQRPEQLFVLCDLSLSGEVSPGGTLSWRSLLDAWLLRMRALRLLCQLPTAENRASYKLLPCDCLLFLQVSMHTTSGVQASIRKYTEEKLMKNK